MLNPRP